MKEAFLHYIWRFQKMNQQDLKTVDEQAVVVIKVGQFLEQAGPDFFNAQLIIGNQKWAGNIEIHLKSSDWYLHHHENDAAYDNVILHVVWEHDTDVFYRNNQTIPVLELKNRVPIALLQEYEKLMAKKSWIYCENQIGQVVPETLQLWLARLFWERLENKAAPILALANETKNDWEAVLFCFLAKSFGLNSNGELFFQSLQQIPFSVIRKESHSLQNLESLIFGCSGLLDGNFEDTYPKQLQVQFEYLKVKYQLTISNSLKPQFFKLRPDNFPTIRLAQFAMLYHKQHQLFSDVISSNSIDTMRVVLEQSVFEYWETHYQLDKLSPKRKKKMSKSFIDLLIMNTIIPFRFAYFQTQGKEEVELLMEFLQQLPFEKNVIIDKFSHFGIKAKNAFESQALLQLKKNYCELGKCLDCEIGISLLKDTEKV